MSNLTKDANDYRPEKDTDKEPCSYSGCLQKKFDHKESISMRNYKADTKVSKHTCKKHDSAINGNYRKQQPHTKDSTCRIPVLVNGLTSMDVSTKNICQKPKSSSQQNKEHKIVIIDARGSTSNVKHNLNDNYRCSGFVRPGANIDTLTSSAMEDIKHLTNNDIIVFWGGTNDVSKNNSQNGLKHINNFMKVNSHTNIILMSVPHQHSLPEWSCVNSLNAELNPICCLLALLGDHHFLHVSRIRVKSLTLRLLMSYIYIYGAPVLDVSRSHTATHRSR